MQSQLYAYLINGILEMNAVSNQSLCNTINNPNNSRPDQTTRKAINKDIQQARQQQNLSNTN